MAGSFREAVRVQLILPKEPASYPQCSLKGMKLLRFARNDTKGPANLIDFTPPEMVNENRNEGFPETCLR